MIDATKAELKAVAEAHVALLAAEDAASKARAARNNLISNEVRHAIRFGTTSSVLIDGKVVTFDSYDPRSGLDVSVTELVDA